MAENLKPIVCPEGDCEMTFTNEEHLGWHKKKHEMMLNLGLENTKNGEIADQTPTPTRFIRNCEEVGLFQDLQNNPFDEIFKKATENVKAGHTLEVPQASNDDTLHTPQIYPQMEQEESAVTKFENCNDFELVIHEVTDHEKDNNTAVVSGNDKEIDESQKKKQKLDIICLKEKIKERLSAKTDKGTIKPVPLHRLRKNAKDRVREQNRAAQERCRQRRAKRWEEMQTELLNLKQENFKLRQANEMLDEKVKDLEALVIANAIQRNKQQINNINLQQTTQASTVVNQPQTTSAPVQPSPTVITSKTPIMNPVVVIMAPTVAGALPPLIQLPMVTTTVTTNTATVPPKDAKAVKSKNGAPPTPALRKIVPKNKLVMPKLKIEKEEVCGDR